MARRRSIRGGDSEPILVEGSTPRGDATRSSGHGGLDSERAVQPEQARERCGRHAIGASKPPGLSRGLHPKPTRLLHQKGRALRVKLRDGPFAQDQPCAARLAHAMCGPEGRVAWDTVAAGGVRGGLRSHAGVRAARARGRCGCRKARSSMRGGSSLGAAAESTEGAAADGQHQGEREREGSARVE